MAGAAARPRKSAAPALSTTATVGRNCPLCPRLKEFRETWRRTEPTWFNAPVPSFGSATARLLIVGLAPGLQGANRTGRPFTGDYAGVLLYDTLARYGFTRGTYGAHPDDGLELVDARITNAVRCVPPENKPTGPEITTCRQFLNATIAEMKNLTAIVALGRVAHETVLAAHALRSKAFPFAHGASHPLERGQEKWKPVFRPDARQDNKPEQNALAPVQLFSSYHCSRYNTNTGVLTPDMFRAVFAEVRAYLDGTRTT